MSSAPQPSDAPSVSSTSTGLASQLGVSDCCLKGNQSVVPSITTYLTLLAQVLINRSHVCGERRFDGTPLGTMIHLGGLEAYLAHPPNSQTPKEGRAIVLLYDIFGLGIKNPKVRMDNGYGRTVKQAWI